MTYSQKLRDPRWQKKRLEVMQRDDFTCLSCGDKGQTLNVHHLKYHHNPWETPTDLLETLCESCHQWRTEVNDWFCRIPTKLVACVPPPLPKKLVDDDDSYHRERRPRRVTTPQPDEDLFG